MRELANKGYTFAQPEEAIFKGQYPRIYDRDIPPTDFYPSYTQTYLERDVRLIKNIADINAFIQFTQLCAGRVGQLLNYVSLASDAGISPNTAKAWLSILETSYVLYRLQPYHQNFTKRLVKASKLYFDDTGLVCSLLGIRRMEQVTTHFMKGALFENLILNEFIKTTLHRGERTYPYFWQDSRGKEIDGLLTIGDGVIPVEIKAGEAMSGSYFNHLKQWQNLTGPPEKGYVVYGGDISLQTGDGFLVSWKQLEQIPY